MTDFVSLRVVVRPGETNAAALHRTLIECGIIDWLPRTLPNIHAGGQVYVASEAKIPLVDTRRFYDTYLVKYE